MSGRREKALEAARAALEPSLGERARTLDLDADLFEAGLDSIGLFGLLAAVEEAVGRRLEPGRLMPGRLRTLRGVVDAVL